MLQIIYTEFTWNLFLSLFKLLLELCRLLAPGPWYALALKSSYGAQINILWDLMSGNTELIVGLTIFLRLSMCFRISHLCSKIPKIYHWSMESDVHSVCFRYDFAIKTVVGFLRKNSFQICGTPSSILFICNSCWLVVLSFLYIDLTLVCCRNPDNVYCFGTIFPNLIFVFASICAARPVPMQSDEQRSCSTVTRPGQTTRWVPLG